MDPRLAGRRLLRPLTARLDGLARRLGALEDAERESRAELTALRDRHAALLQTLEARDAHWETRVAAATAQVAASVDALTAELQAADLERLRHEVQALRVAQAEGVAYLGRRMQRSGAEPDRPPIDA